MASALGKWKVGFWQYLLSWPCHWKEVFIESKFMGSILQSDIKVKNIYCVNHPWVVLQWLLKVLINILVWLQRSNLQSKQVSHPQILCNLIVLRIHLMTCSIFWLCNMYVIYDVYLYLVINLMNLLRACNSKRNQHLVNFRKNCCKIMEESSRIEISNLVQPVFCVKC